MNDFVTFGGVIVAAIISLVAILFAVWPLLQPGRSRMVVEDDRLTELIGRKESTLKAIKDLEFDYRVGKMDDEDFQTHDQRLRRQAIILIQQIEKMAPESVKLDQTLEQQIAARRRTQAQAPAPAPSARPQPVANGNAKPARFCVECGTALEQTHKFCPQCGAAVAVLPAPVTAGETPA